MTEPIHIGDGRFIQPKAWEDLPGPPAPPGPTPRATKYQPRSRAAHFLKHGGRPRGPKGPMKAFKIPGYQQWLFRQRQGMQKLLKNEGFWVDPKTGTQRGLTRRQNAFRWKTAQERARKDIENMKEAGIIDPANERAEEALMVTLTVMRSPANNKDKLAAARQVLEWTRPKPASKSEVTVKSAEAWLDELAEGEETKED